MVRSRLAGGYVAVRYIGMMDWLYKRTGAAGIGLPFPLTTHAGAESNSAPTEQTWLYRIAIYQRYGTSAT